MLLVALAAALGEGSAAAQVRPEGYVTSGLDYFPHVGDVAEFRTRVFAEERIDAGAHVNIVLSGLVEGLVGNRQGDRRAAIARPHDLYVEARFPRFDVRAGLARIPWGRLDELQPSDVINPLDVSRFLFEGRSEARLPVWLVRGRLFLPASLVVETVVVPVFRRGRFDELGEDASPFGLAPHLIVCLAIEVCPPPGVLRREPEVAWKNAQGGLRVSGTRARVDWSVAAYRGIEPFGLVELDRGAGAPGIFVERYPRFTMIGGDFETVRGAWGVRGELAAFVDDSFARGDRVGIVPGQSIDVGIGIDRKAGNYRVAANVVARHERPELGPTSTDTTLVLASERSFARDTRRVRTFGAYNIADDSFFLRGLGSLSLRDNVWLEGSAGWFFGEGTDLIGRFADRDFLYTRIKVYF